MGRTNANALTAHAFVGELAKSGLVAVSTAPGSRSTPLTLAFAAQRRVAVYTHLDERSAAYFALGLALASQRPVALLCTSGTAAANFYPAVVEAFWANVPLLVLSADRPHELRHSGANQTIDQVKLYGDHVLWSHDVAPPEPQPSEHSLRYVRALACRALAACDGLPKGPVHLNFPFRKPLEPSPETPATVEPQALLPHTTMARGTLVPTPEQLDTLAEAVRSAPRGLIVCGPRSPGKGFPSAVARLAQACGYPLLADALSGVRFGPHVGRTVLGGYETYLGTARLSPPQLVLRFGGTPVSKALGDYLASLEGVRQVALSENGVWADADYRLSDVLWADPEAVCDGLVERLRATPPRPDAAWLDRLRELEQTCWHKLDGHFKTEFLDSTALCALVEALPDPAALFVANSLSVRHLDQFARPRLKRLRVYANRGASGIDGTVSSALGVCAALEEPLTLITGDLAFCHDLNGLLAIKRYGLKLTIVVLNNDGGGIFQRLPISGHEPPFRSLFVTPHGLQFKAAADLFGIDYVKVSSQEAFARAFQKASASDSSSLVEICFDAAHNHERHEWIVSEVAEQLEHAAPRGPNA